MAQNSPIPPTMTLLYSMEVLLGDRFSIGSVPTGQERIVIPIVGGTFKGPRMSGKVLNLGADWRLTDANGYVRPDARYNIQIDDGTMVYVTTEGPTLPDGRTLLRGKFETATHGSYAWLNDVVAVGVLNRSGTDKVLIDMWQLLPPDLVELQIGQIDLLMAMYPDEIILEESSKKSLDTLRNEVDVGSAFVSKGAQAIAIALDLPISAPGEEPSSPKTLRLELNVPFVYEGNTPPQDPPEIRVRIQQPFWMSRAATAHIMSQIPDGEDLLGVIEHIKETAAQHLIDSDKKSGDTDTAATKDGPLVRVWFYFPSISTRSKRDDFIKYAPSYKLTGFLYAGKPGLLCVEGESQSIDDYMKFIKTESWGDIPAHHKKVSERYRENCEERVFKEMTEITDVVGERRGQRANRGDMKAVEEWLLERGLGDAFTKVLM